MVCSFNQFLKSGYFRKHLFMNLVPRQKFVERAKGKEHDPDWSGLNVLFMGFDSLSQQAFRRNLPITVEYLEKEMESVVLNGYNIVGDGTPQAFIPILTAKTYLNIFLILIVCFKRRGAPFDA